MRLRGLDVQTAQEARLAGAKGPDPIQLSWVAIHRRTFVTGDWHFLTWGYTVQPHHGLILVPRSVALGKAIEYLELLATGYEPEDVAGRVIIFPNV